MIGRHIFFQCSAASSELSGGRRATRLRSLLLLLAGSSQHVLRFVSAAAAGGPAAEGIRAEDGPSSVIEVLRLWAQGCWAICHQCRLAGPAGSTEQQQEAASAVAGLLSRLLQLLAQLPRLAEATGEPLSSRIVLTAAVEASTLLAHRYATAAHWAVQVLL